MSDPRIEVSEPTLVRNRDGQPVGRLLPGRTYRARSIDAQRVTLIGPDGSAGTVPLSAVTVVADAPPTPDPAAATNEPSDEPAEAEELTKRQQRKQAKRDRDQDPTREPTKRELRKQARRERKQEKLDRRSRAQQELAGATSNPSKVKVTKWGLLVALVVVVLLGGAGAIAVLVATRGQTAEPGWWQHTADEDVGDGDPALDLVLLLGEDEQVQRGEARYDDGDFCFVAIFDGDGDRTGRAPDLDDETISTTGYGHFCDEDTLIEMELPELSLGDGLLRGDFTAYAVVEGERSIVITEGDVVLERRGAPDSADRMERASTWAPTSSEGQPARVARLLNSDLAGASASGYIEVVLCPFGRLRYWQDQQSGSERVVGVGAGQVDADLEGTLLVSQLSPGEPATGEPWVVVIDDENVNLFPPAGPIVVPITNDTTRRCGV